MSPERSQAYGRVLHTIEEIGPTKLHADEQEQIRYTADSLLFCADLRTDDATLDSYENTERMLERLVQGGRWERSTADRLSDDLRACGPAGEFFELPQAA